MDMFHYEKICVSQGFTLVAGVDEAGRGPLAGPVCCAAVILSDEVIEGINDSKKLSQKKREALYEEITKKALAYSIVMVWEREIDEINILQATMQGMKRAVEGLSITPQIVIIDGNKAPEMSIRTETIIGGDTKSASIGAASILAKVTRDRYMVEIDKKYPQYLFEKHKGYGTKAHIEVLKEIGPCEIHRKTFLKKILG